VHTGVDVHEQAPQAQPELHCSIPYMLHCMVAWGVHTPCPAQLPLDCQLPLELHVCVSVPQLPHATLFVCPGAHTPMHAAPLHVWLVHATGLPHWPVPSQVSTPLPEHCF
jgi:hypothetical protein